MEPTLAESNRTWRSAPRYPSYFSLRNGQLWVSHPAVRTVSRCVSSIKRRVNLNTFGVSVGKESWFGWPDHSVSFVTSQADGEIRRQIWMSVSTEMSETQKTLKLPKNQSVRQR
jgi:hypothetical protein